MSKIRFGTDGWRAIIADEFTFSAVERLTQAVADYWNTNPPDGTVRKIIIGFDTRFLSDRFAQSVAEVFAGNGFQVVLSAAPCPTPSLSFSVKHARAVGGVMITASHNPGIFNGFKLKSHLGGSADTTTLRGVERCLDQGRIKKRSFEQACATRRIVQRDLTLTHFGAIRKLVDLELLRKCKLRVVHDSLWGVGAGCFSTLLNGTGCKVTEIRSKPDPMFGGISPEPIPANYAEASTYLKRHPANVCLVTDGDADRLGGLDGRGRPLTTHQIICLILNHLLVNRRQKGKVVKSITTSSMVDKICAAHRLSVTETGVGFKFICAEMNHGDVLAGVEESGGIAIRGHIPERDGLAAGVILLELLALRKRSVRQLLAELEKQFGPHCYARKDLYAEVKLQSSLRHLTKSPPCKLGRSPVERVQTFDGLKLTAQDSSWLMFRGSGTEPVIRIYAESGSQAAVTTLLRRGERLLRSV